ncbi:HlyD family efflux transporter periplasmic adaptor subunit [Massilia sp. PAMC28688]|uniref:efflux RND transporter periplasmic adaptor subunit n=1 Tax=Massilia sp. PAMC28688 TaxID=2861283 RepID=UPI001C638C4D|nr:HlyD family efflux transporter periplasmic adaptor subunit [Massilia sp. PAMC28688]QYF92714.1 HlyD family efflux transporter periplasmic adaptor subunit [Massilia sp. PAMC28688]
MSADGQPGESVLAHLLALARDVTQAKSEDLASYAIVNQTFQLLPYHMAALWRPGDDGGGRITHASGLAKIEADSPFVMWLNALALAHLAGGAGSASAPAQLSAASVPEKLGSQWAEWLPAHLLWMPLPSPAEPWPGVLLLARETAFDASEVALLGEAAGLYGHALWGWQRRHRNWRARLRQLAARRRVRVGALLAASVLLLPLRLSVVVDGEVIAQAPIVLAAPADAPIREVMVRPNQAVKAGDVLYVLDDAGVRNRLAVAAKTLEIARADWLRSSQKGFADEASRSDVAALSARIEEKQAELGYLKELSQRLTVRAPAAGVVVFSDPLDLVGKPVVTGEHVMTLSDPARVALQAWLPPADAIALAPGAQMSLSLFTAPLGSVQATLEDSSYETEIAPQGHSAFRLRGRFAPGEAPQLGLKGTVRLYGERAPLIYHMLRRPLAGMRRLLGV